MILDTRRVDEALIYACENLKAHFPDKCVYRIGGDEFLVLIPGITENLFQSMIRSMLVDMAKVRFTWHLVLSGG